MAPLLCTGLKIVNLLCLQKKMKALNNFQVQKIEKGLYLLIEETYRESKHEFETFVFHCNCGKEGRRKDCLLNNIEPLALLSRALPKRA